MTWWWDNWVRPYDLYWHFEILSRYISGINWVKELLMPLQTHVEPRDENVGDFIFAPGLGWAKTTRAEFTIRPDGVVENLDEGSVYVHGQYHPEMGPNPVFLLTAPRPTRFGLRIERVARSGAVCTILLDRERIVRRIFKASSSDYSPGEEGNISLDIPAGSHRISVRNTGPDWYQVGHYRIENFVQRPVAYARGNDDLILLWVHDRPHQYATLSEYGKYGPVRKTTVRITEIHDGEFYVEQFDPYSGNVVPLQNIRADQGGLSVELPEFRRDIAFRLRRVPASVQCRSAQ